MGIIPGSMVNLRHCAAVLALRFAYALMPADRTKARFRLFLNHWMALEHEECLRVLARAEAQTDLKNKVQPTERVLPGPITDEQIPTFPRKASRKR